MDQVIFAYSVLESRQQIAGVLIDRLDYRGIEEHDYTPEIHVLGVGHLVKLLGIYQQHVSGDKSVRLVLDIIVDALFELKIYIVHLMLMKIAVLGSSMLFIL